MLSEWNNPNLFLSHLIDLISAVLPLTNTDSHNTNISSQIMPINTESVWRQAAAMQPGEKDKMSREKGERGKRWFSLKFLKWFYWNCYWVQFINLSLSVSVWRTLLAILHTHFSSVSGQLYHIIVITFICTRTDTDTLSHTHAAQREANWHANLAINPPVKLVKIWISLVKTLSAWKNGNICISV